MWPFRKHVQLDPVRQEPTIKETDSVHVKRRPQVRLREAESGIASRLTADWTTTPTHIDQVIFNNLRILVARSRERYINDDYAQRFVGLVRSNVVGPNGFGFQSQAIDNNEQDDQPARIAIEKAFKDYRKKANCDFYGKLSFTELTNMIVSSIVVDGEAIIRYHKTGPYGLLMELIDPQKLDVSYNDRLKNGNNIRFGIEYSKSGLVAAYHLIQESATDNSYIASYNSRNYERVPASEIDHLYLHLFVGQKRGLPWMTSGMLRLKMLTGFEDASLVNARASASKMGFYEIESGDDGPGGERLDDGSVVTDFEVGTIHELPEGVSFKEYNPTYPSGEFEVFSKSVLRGVASGFGVDYCSLANNLEGVNFSSLRHGELLNRELWKAIQHWLIENWLIDFTENRWIVVQQAKGNIKIAGKGLSRPISNYLPHRWQGRRWDWVDPAKDISAKETEYNLGATSLSQIIRERGRDPEEVWREIEQERKRMKELGIEPGNLLGSLVSGAKKQSEKVEKDDGEDDKNT